MRNNVSSYFRTPIDVQKDNRKSAFWVWMSFIAIAIVYDYFAIRSKKRESLTRTFWRLTDHPVKGAFLLTVWFTITAHLVLEKAIRRKLSK